MGHPRSRRQHRQAGPARRSARANYKRKAGSYRPVFRKELSSGLTAYRSAEDGVWRVWGPRSPQQLGLKGYPDRQIIQVCLGAHEKLSEAHLIAKGKRPPA